MVSRGNRGNKVRNQVVRAKRISRSEKLRSEGHVRQEEEVAGMHAPKSVEK